MLSAQSTSVRPRGTLADLLRGPALLRDALLVVGFSLFMALCAQISIPLPWTPVPITGQTLGFLLAPAVLGPQRGLLAALLYLGQGAIGLPFFAPSATLPNGFARLMGPTGGYLMAAPITAVIVGYLAARGWDRRLFSGLAMFLIGTVVILMIGAIWLNIYKETFQLGTLHQLLWAGVYPYLPGEAVKIALAALAMRGCWELFGRQHS